MDALQRGEVVEVTVEPWLHLDWIRANDPRRPADSGDPCGKGSCHVSVKGL